MDASKNIELWKEVCKTPPSYTKKVNQRGGYTAIDPTYQAQQATHMFGPFGVGWGFKESSLDLTLVDTTGMVIHKAVFFFKFRDELGEFPIHNAISIWSDKGKTRLDEDFAKKVETNTISKSLSRLGFSADVFLGFFDDVNYVNDAKASEAMAIAENKEAELKKQKEEFFEWAQKELKAYELIPNKSALRTVLNGHLKKAEASCVRLKINYIELKKRFDAAYTAQLQKIEASTTQQGAAQ